MYYQKEKMKKERKREVKQGVTYHTFSRLINKLPLMKAKKLKYLMEHVINKALKKYNFEMNIYTLLDNHFHFLITTIEDEATISLIMQFIKAQFAMRYNRMMNRTGPVWNERYGHTIIENAENPQFYFNWLCMYIFYNSVRKGYVTDPRDYKFSCMQYYLDENFRPRVKLTLSKYFLKLGDSFQERVKKFLEFESFYLFCQKNKDFIFAWLMSKNLKSFQEN